MRWEMWWWCVYVCIYICMLLHVCWCLYLIWFKYNIIITERNNNNDITTYNKTKQNDIYMIKHKTNDGFTLWLLVCLYAMRARVYDFFCFGLFCLFCVIIIIIIIYYCIIIYIIVLYCFGYVWWWKWKNEKSIYYIVYIPERERER